MEDYELINRLGGGSFADVYKAREKSTGEIVAIKILKKKYKKWEECLELREVKSLQKLQDDSLSNQKGVDNIIKLKQIIFINKTGTLNLVFEYMEKDLFALMKSREPKTLSEYEIKDFIYQTLLGLAHMHKYGFFHRDMKPENLLITNNKLKIADFGLAREIRSIPPYTEYVSTRYYRAPECILKSTNYNSPIDIWALGCIMAEMYLHPQPLFYGANEKEVLYRICSILGTPTYDIWLEGVTQAQLIGFKFPNNSGIPIKNIIKNASDDAIDLICQMIKWDPNKRATAQSLLNHKFFEGFICSQNNLSLNFSKNSDFFNNENVKKYCSNNNKVNKNNNNDKKNELKVSGVKDEENEFSKMLNDTEGFNKLINMLKKEKNEDDDNYEKEKNKLNCYENNDFKNLLLSNDYNEFFKESIADLKEQKKKEKEFDDLLNDPEDSIRRSRTNFKNNFKNNNLNIDIFNNTNQNTNDNFEEKDKNPEKNVFLPKNLKLKPIQLIPTDNNNTNINYPSDYYHNKNYPNNINNNLNINPIYQNDKSIKPNRKCVLGKSISCKNMGEFSHQTVPNNSNINNNYDKEKEKDDFETKVKLKPINLSNRRGSAKKFLENTKEKINGSGGSTTTDANSPSENNNYKNDYNINLFGYNSKNVYPVIMKNNFNRGGLDKLLDGLQQDNNSYKIGGYGGGTSIYNKKYNKNLCPPPIINKFQMRRNDSIFGEDSRRNRPYNFGLP